MHTKEILKKIAEENSDKPDFYIRNLLKEYLQILILHYIYSSGEYKSLFFYGGTCLAQCYNLPRLSEDLDFVDVKKEIKIKKLAKDIEKFFKEQIKLPVEVKTQKFRIYFKFPILKELGFASSKSESDYLFVKVEIFSGFDFCADFKEAFIPIFKFNYSILIKTFDLPTLMATKIRAVLYRKWEQTNKKGDTLTKVKGRDFFDLMWFLQKGVEPNFNCLERISNKDELADILLEKIKKIDKKSIEYDLKNFISDQNFVADVSENIKNILEAIIKNKKDL